MINSGGADVVLMDYVMSALDGANGEYYVPGTFPCANNTKYFEIDATRTTTNFQYKPQAFDTLQGSEDVVFNTTATLSGYLPDAIYYCYFVPGTAYRLWTAHYQTFYNLQDFEGAFIQNIMGNFLSFIDIYNKVYVAAENGDFLTVVNQMARLLRRLMDFRSMQRESLVVASSLNRLTSYLEYYASLDDLNSGNPKPTRVDLDWTSPQDYVTTVISLFTGFVDGSFRASNTSSCRKSLKLYTASFSNATRALFVDGNENATLWYWTRVLKYTHPSAFHCYFAGKETGVTFYQYASFTSAKDIGYNVVYKTGKMFDQIRVIYRLISRGNLQDRDIYVIARSIGILMNIILQSDAPRAQYSTL